MSPTRMPAGRQPYDPLNAVRIGALAGGLAGGPFTYVSGSPWFVIAGAVAGGMGGFVYHRTLRREGSD